MGSVKKMLGYVLEFVKNKKQVRFAVVHANNIQKAHYIVQRLKEKFGDVQIPILPVCPVLGAHAGNGAAAVGITWE